MIIDHTGATGQSGFITSVTSLSFIEGVSLGDNSKIVIPLKVDISQGVKKLDLNTTQSKMKLSGGAL